MIDVWSYLYGAIRCCTNYEYLHHCVRLVPLMWVPTEPERAFALDQPGRGYPDGDEVDSWLIPTSCWLLFHVIDYCPNNMDNYFSEGPSIINHTVTMIYQSRLSSSFMISYQSSLLHAYHTVLLTYQRSVTLRRCFLVGSDHDYRTQPGTERGRRVNGSGSGAKLIRC